MSITAAVGRGCANRRADVRTIQVLLNLNAARFALAPLLACDGSCGQATVGALDAFQRRVLGMPLPTGVVPPDSATLRALVAGMSPGLSPEKLHGIMVNAAPQRIALYGEVLLSIMTERNIDSPRRQAHFLAQIAHESGELAFAEEIATGDAYEGRVDLGNTQPGDGRRFKGRGLIQLTGRANYIAYGNAAGLDLISGDNARRVSDDPRLAVDVACWFWQTRGLNVLADTDDVLAVTRRINGGLNGLADRERQLARAKFFLAL